MHGLLHRIIAANIGMSLFNMYLYQRQWHKALETFEEPPELKVSANSSPAFIITRTKELFRMQSSFINDFLDLLTKSVKICIYFPSWLWLWVTSYFKNSYTQTAMYAVSETILNDTLSFPLILLTNAWSDSSEMDEISFIQWYVKSSVRNWMIIGMVTYYRALILDLSGAQFFLMAWFGKFLISFLLASWLFDLIIPFDGNYMKVLGGRFKEKVEELAHEFEFPLTSIYIYRGDQFSDHHSLAYYTGILYEHCIIISITLLITHSEEEILAVVTHQLGHWKLGHQWTNQLTSFLYFFGLWYILGRYYDSPELYEAFEYSVPNSAQSILIICDYLVPPVEKILTILQNYYLRSCEYQADQFVKELGKTEHLKSALIKSYKICSAFPVTDPLFGLCCDSQPSVMERVRALNFTPDLVE